MNGQKKANERGIGLVISQMAELAKTRLLIRGVFNPENVCFLIASAVKTFKYSEFTETTDEFFVYRIFTYQYNYRFMSDEKYGWSHCLFQQIIARGIEEVFEGKLKRVARSLYIPVGIPIGHEGTECPATTEIPAAWFYDANEVRVFRRQGSEYKELPAGGIVVLEHLSRMAGMICNTDPWYGDKRHPEWATYQRLERFISDQAKKWQELIGPMAD